MPRFFFHIRSRDQNLSCDRLGLDFPDVESTCSEAFCAALTLSDVFAARGQDPRDYALEIVNAAGGLVLSVTFSEIFRAEAWGPLLLVAEPAGTA